MSDRYRGRRFSSSDDRVNRRRAYREEVSPEEIARYDPSRYVSSSRNPDSDAGPADEEAAFLRRGSTSQEKPEAEEREPYYDNFFEDMRMEEEREQAERRRSQRQASSQAAKEMGRDTATDVRSRSRRTRGRSDSPRPGDMSRMVEAAPKKPGGKGKRIALIVVAVIAVLVAAGAGAAFAYMSNINENLHEGVDDKLLDVLVETDMAKEPFYMLLLGTDGSAERDNDPSIAGSYRSDSMMLARIDAPNKKATLISINRDVIVDFGGEYGEQKINSAYGIGGPALAVETVSKLAGVKISHYAQVDFDGFSALVDALGGVEVDVPIDIDDWEAGGSVSAGRHTLTGQEALILCRSRNSYTYTAAHPDQMRAANQRLVMGAIAKKILSSDVATIATSVQALSKYVITDLAVTDIVGLAQAMQGMDPATDIYTAMMPTESKYENETWFEEVKTKEWQEMMKRVDQGLPPTEETEVDEVTGTVVATAGSASPSSSASKNSTITVKNGSDVQGAAAKVRTKLLDSGFQTVIVGDITEGYQYPATLVVYNEASGQHEAEEIAKILGQGAPFLNDGSYLLTDTDYLVIIGEDWVPQS